MKILYLDDEKEILELALDYFDDHGVVIDVCSSPTQALELVKSKRFDVIFSDAKMPEMSGLEFLQKIQKDFQYSGHFILVSGHYELTPRDEIPLGVSAHLLKPIEFGELYKLALSLVSQSQ